jgi:tripartite-type tricarboxylate transporter receptor subunit TctC
MGIKTLGAQTYPTQSVRIIVPTVPAGGVDIMARLVASAFTDSFGQKFFVENRTPSMLAAEVVAKAPPNGHTLMVSTATYLVNRLLYKNLNYDPITDLSPISLIGSTPIILVIHPSLPVPSLRELIRLAHRKPGSLNFASGGNGSPLHLAGELFNQEAKVNIIHVPYRGTAPATLDLLAGQTQLMFPSVLSMYPYIQSGKTRVLSILAPQRSAVLADVPTTAEAGLPHLTASIWYGLLATGGTPAAIQMDLYRAMTKALSEPRFQARLARDAVQAIGSTPEAYTQFALEEYEKWGKVIRKARIQLD